MLRGSVLCVILASGCLADQGTRAEVDDAESDARTIDDVMLETEVVETAVPEVVETAVPEVVVPAPCINLRPRRLDFNFDRVGAQTATIMVESCGDATLVIDEVSLTDNGGGQYDVYRGGEPGELAPGTTKSIVVRFLPGSEGAAPPNGELRIRSNASPSELLVPISSFGTSIECPIAVITVAEGNEAVPQSTLYLDGTGSYRRDGIAIVGYEWTVIQPGGSASVFLPSAQVAQPTFEANIVGSYVFRLSVVDAFGNRSCVPAEYRVEVRTDQAISVVVMWQTAGDPNASDVPAAANVDLHFLHPLAGDELFGAYDCYFGNPNPEWGIFSPSDNPRLSGYDGSSEVVSLDVPEQGVRYQVNAHYADAAEQGPARAEILIYIYGVLRDQWTAELDEHDLWSSHTIDWPSGVVSRIGDGEPVIRTLIPTNSD